MDVVWEERETERSVLWGLPAETGTAVAGRIVRDLVAKLYGPDAQPWPSNDQHVAWLIQVSTVTRVPCPLVSSLASEELRGLQIHIQVDPYKAQA